MRLLLLLTALLSLPPAPAAQDGMRRRVEQTVSEWRSRPRLPEERLVQGLLALGPEAVPVLCAQLEEPMDGLPVGAVARTLARSGGPQALAALVQLVSSEDAAHRELAATALGAMQEAGALEPLLGALGDPQVRVQLSAAQAVTDLVGREVVEPPVAQLVRGLRASEEREGFAFALARLPGEHAREQLYQLAEDGFDQGVALAALMGLWESPQPTDAPVVATLLREADFPAVRKQACLLAGRLEHRPSVPDLIELLREEDPGLVKNAHWALVRISGQSLGPDPALWEVWWKSASQRPPG